MYPPPLHLTRVARLLVAPAFLLFALAGCGDREVLGPDQPEVAGPPAPRFAFAQTNFWARKAPMPTARYTLAVGVVNNVLYAVGGGAQAVSFRTVEAYTPGSDSWTTKALLPEARSLLNGAGTINGVLYVAGGANPQGFATTTLYAYSPSTNTWTTKRPMFLSAACGASAVLGNKLYVYSSAAGCGPVGNATALRSRHRPVGHAGRSQLRAYLGDGGRSRGEVGPPRRH
jgi:hypothetical protein